MIFSVKRSLFLGLILFFAAVSPFSANAEQEPTQQINIQGLVNINKDPAENGYLPFGRYVFVGNHPYTGPSRIDGNVRAVPASGITFYIIQGYQAISIGNGFYLIFGTRDSRGEVWGQMLGDVYSPGNLLVSVVTDNSGSDFVGKFTYGSNSTLLGRVVDMTKQLCGKDSTGSNVCLNVYVHLDFNVSNSTCQIITAHNMAFYWAALTPSEISNGSAQSKTAPVTMKCSNPGGIEPAAISFTSTNGTYDATKGIVNTDLENLGIQLTWASTGQPVQLDKETVFPALASATADYSVTAKPVQLGNQSVLGGTFKTMVTMSIEYR